MFAGTSIRRPALALLAAVPVLACSAAHGASEILIGNIASTTNPTSKENSTNLILGYSVYFEHVNRQGGIPPTRRSRRWPASSTPRAWSS